MAESAITAPSGGTGASPATTGKRRERPPTSSIRAWVSPGLTVIPWRNPDGKKPGAAASSRER